MAIIVLSIAVILFRIIVPSIFFVAIHLPTEQFGFERIGVLFMAGLLQGIAYADMIMLVVFSATFALLLGHRRKLPPVPIGAG